MTDNMKFYLFYFFFFCETTLALSYKAVVFWHGMGDFSSNPGLMQLKEAIQEAHPGTYVKSIRIGNNMPEDIENGFLMNVNKQIDMVCDELSKDEKLKEGFHAIGFSQGGQFLRGLIQRCSAINPLNLISLGGQHQGVYGFPKCPESLRVCEYAREMVSYGAYESYIQNHIVQAEYWHDPLKEKEYRERSVFLADINQEIKYNETYKTNLMRLRNFVLVMFTKETIVTPKESEWFGFYKAGQDKLLYTMKESALYQENLLGLKEMDNEGRLHFLSVENDHIKFSLAWFKQEIINNWLSD